MPMTRTEMEAVIAAGGSVLHQGRIISRVGDLPSEAALASTDEERAGAAEALHAKIAALQAQVDALSAAQSPTAEPAPAAEPPAAKLAKDEKAAKKAENL